MVEINTYFISERRRRRRREILIKTSLSLGILGLLIVGALWLIIYSPLFQFEKIEIKVSEEVGEEKILDFLQAKVISGSFWNKFLGLKNFLNWPPKINSEELMSLPEIKSIKIQKNYQNDTIIIEAEERKPLGIWCFKKSSPAECFWFDKEGILIRSTLAAGGNLIKVIHDFYGENLGLGSKILPPKFIPNLISIIEVLNRSNLSTREIILNDLVLEEVEVPAGGGPKLYFSLRHPAYRYLEVIQSLTQDPDFGNLSYLDLRVENRVYYK